MGCRNCLLPTYPSHRLHPRTSSPSITSLHCPGQYEVRKVKGSGQVGLLACTVLIMVLTYTMKKECLVKCDEMM